MGELIKVDFIKRRIESMTYSADVYSIDMKKYQFQTRAMSIADAYQKFIEQAKNYAVHYVRLIAIYDGEISARSSFQTPVKVWQQEYGEPGLVES